MEDFKNIQFEEKTPTDLNTVISISKVIEMVSEPFDGQAIAQKTHDKHFNNPNSEYYRMSVDEILENWQERGASSRHYGTLLDNYIGLILTNADEMDVEMYKLDYDSDNDDRLSGLISSFDNFNNEILKAHPNLEYVNREQTVYYKVSDGTYIKGRFDALFYNKDNGHYVIVDWKSSGTVDKKPSPWTGKLLGPAKNLYALNYNTYSMQVYFYKTALEQMGYLPENSIVDCVIVQLPGSILAESNKNYCVHNPAFEYDKLLLDQIFTYAIKKNMLLEKKNAK